MQKDNSTFLFSFNNKEKYTSVNNFGNNFSICSQPKKNPFFRNEEPNINFNDTLDIVKLYGRYYFNSFPLPKKLANGEENVDVKELEIYKITYLKKI